MDGIYNKTVMSHGQDGVQDGVYIAGVDGAYMAVHGAGPVRAGPVAMSGPLMTLSGFSAFQLPTIILKRKAWLKKSTMRTNVHRSSNIGHNYSSRHTNNGRMKRRKRRRRKGQHQQQWKQQCCSSSSRI